VRPMSNAGRPITGY